MVARLHLRHGPLNVPCGSDEHLRRPGVGLLRLCEVEANDLLLLGEIPDAHGGREVAVHGLDPELVGPVGQGEPFFPGELDRGLLAEGGLIAPDLHAIHELGDDHVVALDVADGVLLGEAAGLEPDVAVLPGDSGRGVGALEGENTVGDAALAIRDGDLERVDGVEAQRVELLGGDGQREPALLRGVVDGAEDFVIEGLRDGERVVVRVGDGVVVGEAQIFVAQVSIDAGDRRRGVGAGERPRPGRRASLPIRDDDLDRMLAEAQFIDRDEDAIFRFSRRGERLRRPPIARLRRRQDVAGVGVVHGVLYRKIAVLIT